MTTLTQSGCGDLTVLEGEEFEDAVHDGDDDGETQQVGVGLQQGHLHREHLILHRLYFLYSF